MRDVDAAPRLDEAEVGRIFREESGRSVATLIRVFGDIDVAEDAVQQAFAVAHVVGQTCHPNPGGWIRIGSQRRGWPPGPVGQSCLRSTKLPDHCRSPDPLRRVGERRS